MEPTLLVGDYILVTKFSYGVKLMGRTVIELEGPRRGDIIVFRYPPEPSKDYIKRVIGLPGERVTAKERQISINDRVLADRWGDGSMDANSERSVPEGAVWVLGDNRRSSSIDSRVLDVIPIGDVGWIVVARYWPPSRAARINS